MGWFRSEYFGPLNYMIVPNAIHFMYFMVKCVGRGVKAEITGGKLKRDSNSMMMSLTMLPLYVKLKQDSLFLVTAVMSW